VNAGGWNVTFETITPESAEDGEAAARGWLAEGVPLREALEAFDGWGCEGGVEASDWPFDDPRWITAYDTDRGRSYWEQGETTNHSLHFPEGVTPASKRRIFRLVGGRS
jgi:hypothetical protein